MNETAIDVLLPKTKNIVLCGKRVCVKPLTLRQLLGSFEVLRVAKADISMPSGASDHAFMLKMMTTAGDSLPALVAVISGQSPEDLREISLEEVSELALAVAETNDFGKIFSNFEQAMEKSQPKK